MSAPHQRSVAILDVVRFELGLDAPGHFCLCYSRKWSRCSLRRYHLSTVVN